MRNPLTYHNIYWFKSKNQTNCKQQQNSYKAVNEHLQPCATPYTSWWSSLSSMIRSCTLKKQENCRETLCLMNIKSECFGSTFEAVLGVDQPLLHTGPAPHKRSTTGGKNWSLHYICKMSNKRVSNNENVVSMYVFVCLCVHTCVYEHTSKVNLRRTVKQTALFCMLIIEISSMPMQYV